MSEAFRVTIWHEFRHEKRNPVVSALYPQGMHAAIADGLRMFGDFDIRLVALDDPEQGLPEATLNNTDVLVWWGHLAHHEVADALAERVQQRVLDGMGLVVLHSGHMSKPFRRLMGTGCMLKWREADDNERIWIVNPGHAIARGLPERIEIEAEEMYGEHFDVPTPDELVAISWFKGGEVFRSACCWYRGAGRVFYFRPGHETYPTYYHQDVRRVIANGVRWAAPVGGAAPLRGNTQPVQS
ncbi:MAG: ThuA domain-containing protein [Thermoflexales bacterium]|nr:ThuA domain-containing protein [Thermoflexales bacterium]